MEVKIPTKIGMPTLPTGILEEANAKAITKDLNLSDELCEDVAIRITSYQQRLKNLYNKWVKQQTFQDGDLVLRRVFENTANPAYGKF